MLNTNRQKHQKPVFVVFVGSLLTFSQNFGFKHGDMMNQEPRPTATRQPASRLKRVHQYDQDNLSAALIIADDPQAFPEDSLAAQWAASVIGRLNGEPKQRRPRGQIA